MRIATFSGTLTSKFSLSAPSTPQLFFSCCAVFGQYDQDSSESLGCFLTFWADSWGVNLCHKHAQLEEVMQQEFRAAQRMEWEVWRSFKAALSPPSPNWFLILNKLLWAQWCSFKKPLLSPFHSLFSLLSWQMTGTFLPLIRFSFPILISNFNILCLLLLSIIFHFKKRKGWSTVIPII